MKKMFLVPLAFAAVVAAGYVSYGAYSPQSEEDALLLENVEALTKGDVVSPCPWGYGKFYSEAPDEWSKLESFTYCNGCSDKQGYNPQDKGCK